MFYIRRFFSGASPSRIATMEATQSKIIEALKDSRGLTMFSKSTCPFCERAQGRVDKFLGEYISPKKKASSKVDEIKNMPDEKQPYNVLELDLLNDPYMQDLLNTRDFAYTKLGDEGFEPKEEQRTVPNIWIGGKQIGGCDAFMSLSDKQIRAMLEAAGAKLL